MQKLHYPWITFRCFVTSLIVLHIINYHVIFIPYFRNKGRRIEGDHHFADPVMHTCIIYEQYEVIVHEIESTSYIFLAL